MSIWVSKIKRIDLSVWPTISPFKRGHHSKLLKPDWSLYLLKVWIMDRVNLLLQLTLGCLDFFRSVLATFTNRDHPNQITNQTKTFTCMKTNFLHFKSVNWVGWAQFEKICSFDWKNQLTLHFLVLYVIGCGTLFDAQIGKKILCLVAWIFA